MTEKVFVYGTLRGRESFGKVRPAVVPGAEMYYHLLTASYPAAFISQDERDFIVGEIIEVSDSVLKNLDRYEGYRENDKENSLYHRVRVTAVSDYPEECWMYVGNLAVPLIRDIRERGEKITDWAVISGENFIYRNS